MVAIPCKACTAMPHLSEQARVVAWWPQSGLRGSFLSFGTVMASHGPRASYLTLHGLVHKTLISSACPTQRLLEFNQLKTKHSEQCLAGGMLNKC